MKKIQFVKFRYVAILFIATIPILFNLTYELLNLDMVFAMIAAFLLSLSIVLFFRLFPRLMGWFCVICYYGMIITAFVLIYLHLSRTVQFYRFPFELLLVFFCFSHIASKFCPKTLLHTYLKKSESNDFNSYASRREFYNRNPFADLNGAHSPQHDNTRALSGIPNALYMSMQQAKEQIKNHEKNDKSIIPKSEND